MTEDDDKTLIDPAGSGPIGPTGPIGPNGLSMTGAALLLPPMPTRIGKFEILRKLGEGGMGVVYEGVDPKLGRRVAVKLMRPSQRQDRDSHGQDRMMREATTLARLSHPNVVQVYEVGEFENAVFLAMELVAGVDLRVWLKARPRKWREVLAVFLQAGQGLAAAHNVGVVHRDFKPDNVLVGDDGRVRVLDFGLARPVRGGDVQEVIHPTAPSANRITLTQANSYVGTPAYMSPEQHLRERADARSDQFSFCVALYEGLYGERPFAGKTAAEVRMSVFRALPPPPEGRRVPARLRRILNRGLRVDADERYPDMPALLADLSVDPTKPWKRAGLVAATIAVAAAGAVAYARIQGGPAQCTAGADIVARVWNDSRAAAGAAAFTLTGVAYAPDTWPKVQAELDAYAADLAEHRDDACRAVIGRGDGGDTLPGLRLQCLDERQRDLGALVDALVTADAATVERAVQAATALTPLAACDDENYVSSRLRPPVDPVLAQKVERARDDLARAAARRDAGRPLEAREIAEAVDKDTAELAYPPLHAEVLLELGRGEETTADYAVAIDHLTRAYHDGLAIGHDTVAAEAAIVLVLAHHRQGKFEAAFAWSEHARSMVRRTGERPEHNVPFLLYRSYTLSRLGRPLEAITTAEQALTIAEASFRPNDPRIGRMIAGVAHAHWNNGDSDRALELFQRSKAVWQAGVGADHPYIASSAINISTIYHNRHQYDRALAEVRPALDMMTRAYGPDHPSVANVLGNLGSIALAQGRFGEAIDDLSRCVDILTRKLGDDDPQALEAAGDLATAQLLIGREEAALATQQHMMNLLRARPDAALALENLELAEILGDLGKSAEAQVAYDAALTEAERSANPSPAIAIHALAGLARLARERGDLPEADELSRRTTVATLDVQPIERAPGLVERGLTLLALGRPDEAVIPCKQALLEFEKAYGPVSYQNVPALLCLGRIYTARTQDAAAEQILTRAVDILDATDIRPADRADARAALAAAVRRNDPARADTLTTRALADYEAAGPRHAAAAAALRKPAAQRPK